MDLNLEMLEELEAPMSDEFWDGVVAGVSIIGAVVGIGLAAAALT